MFFFSFDYLCNPIKCFIIATWSNAIVLNINFISLLDYKSNRNIRRVIGCVLLLNS